MTARDPRNQRAIQLAFRLEHTIALAQEEARLLKHSYIGTEHILLGLSREGDGVAARVLDELKITLPVIREQVETVIGFGKESPLGHLNFTPRCKKVLELSLREALQLGHNYIGTEHLLLAMIREGQGVGCQIMTTSGTKPDLPALRQAVMHALIGKVKMTRLLYLRSPVDPNAYVDANLPGIQVLLESGWTLVERLITPISCPGCGQTHSFDRYVVASEDNPLKECTP